MLEKASNYDFVILLLNRAAELIKKGERERAIEVLSNAVEYADEIEDAMEKTSAFIQIARAFYMAGEQNKSREILDSISEELRDTNIDDKDFLEVIVGVEKVRLNIDGEDRIVLLEGLRKRLEAILDRTGRVNVARYYIAFLTMLWLPEMMERDIEKAESVIRDAIDRVSFIRGDPQYAELLTALAEIHTKISKIEDALRNLRDAIRIYKRNLAEFDETIKAIMDFVRENFPDKYDDFLKEVERDEE